MGEMGVLGSRTPPRFPELEATLTAARRLESELNRQLCEHAGLSYDQYQTLATLAEQPDHRMKMSDLAREVGTSRSCLSHAIARTEARGWVLRVPDPQDARGVRAALTEDGLTAVTAAGPVYRHVVHELSTDLVGLRRAG